MNENTKLSNILKNLSILYVEDEENIRVNVKKVLELFCNVIYDVDNVEEAKQILERKNRYNYL